MSKERTLGVAVIGLGVGESHARAYHADPRCRLRWVVDHDPARAAALASKLQAGVGHSFEAVLTDQAVQIISLASYDNDHARQVLQALEAGKHVFVEKPLCQTLDELQRIRQVWFKRKGELKLACNLILRSAPIYRWLKERLLAGVFGRIYSFDGEYLYGRLQKITEGWRSEVENYSVMEGGGIHMIDLMLWLTGERPRTVVSMANRISTEGTKYRYNDFVASTMQMESGLIGRIVANFGCVHRHQHVVRIYGTKGTFVYDDSGARIHLTRAETAKAAPVGLPTLPTGKGDLIPAFVSAVWNDEDLRDQTQEVFDGLSVSVACDRAAETQEMERVNYV